MRETGFLFKEEMVRAILEDRKWVTRRLIKPQPIPEPARASFYRGNEWLWESNSGKIGIFHPPSARCRYGSPGGMMWVMETWARPEYASQTLFKADYQTTLYEDEDCERPVKWKPGIHLPKSLSRIRRKIVSVRPERLQDITEDEANAEGFPSHLSVQTLDPAKLGFALYWDSINPDFPWAKNPWVWRIEFERKESK